MDEQNGITQALRPGGFPVIVEGSCSKPCVKNLLAKAKKMINLGAGKSQSYGLDNRFSSPSGFNGNSLPPGQM